MHSLKAIYDDTSQSVILVMGKFDSDMDWLNLAQHVGAPDSYKFPTA